MKLFCYIYVKVFSENTFNCLDITKTFWKINATKDFVTYINYIITQY